MCKQLIRIGYMCCIFKWSIMATGVDFDDWNNVDFYNEERYILKICTLKIWIIFHKLHPYQNWKSVSHPWAHRYAFFFFQVNMSYPATPPLSMWFARVTSSLHTSNCHLRNPSTPHRTLPVWMPIRMSTLNPVASRTNLLLVWREQEKSKALKWRCNNWIPDAIKTCFNEQNLHRLE